MQCPRCGSNSAYHAQDGDGKNIVVCPTCTGVLYPVPSVEDLKKDAEQIKERMRSIPNMPLTEEE